MNKQIAWLLGATVLASCGAPRLSPSGGGGGGSILAPLASSVLQASPTGSIRPSAATSTAPASAAPSARASVAPSATPSLQPSFNPNMSSTEFLRFATQVNLAEIAEGRLALQRSTNAAVKGFAQQMISDHTQANAQVARTAALEGVTPPATPRPDQQDALARLQTLTGAAFDQAYMRDQIFGHVQALHVLAAQANGRDRNIQSLAGQLLPEIENHLRMAQTVSAGLAFPRPFTRR